MMADISHQLSSKNLISQHVNGRRHNFHLFFAPAVESDILMQDRYIFTFIVGISRYGLLLLLLPHNYHCRRVSPFVVVVVVVITPSAFNEP
jgi:hypothetical protein